MPVTWRGIAGLGSIMELPRGDKAGAHGAAGLREDASREPEEEKEKEKEAAQPEHPSVDPFADAATDWGLATAAEFEPYTPDAVVADPFAVAPRGEGVARPVLAAPAPVPAPVASAPAPSSAESATCPANASAEASVKTEKTATVQAAEPAVKAEANADETAADVRGDAPLLRRNNSLKPIREPQPGVVSPVPAADATTTTPSSENNDLPRRQEALLTPVIRPEQLESHRDDFYDDDVDDDGWA